MKLVFDTHNNEKQKQAVTYWVTPGITDIVYGGSKGSGKSYLGCKLIFGNALIYADTSYFIARKKLNDLRKYTAQSVRECFDHWGLGEEYYRFNAQDNFYTLYNNSRVYFIEADFMPSDPDFQRFGSQQHTQGWIEEAGELTEDAKNNLSATVGRWKNEQYGIEGKVLQTCNPSKNYLYRGYYKTHKAGTLESWRRFIQALPEDNKKIPREYLEHLNRIFSKNQRERLLKGNWEYDDDPKVLCGYENIINIFTNAFVSHGTKYISADVARFGKDSTIIRVWSGWRVLKRVQLDKYSTADVAKKIRELATANMVPMSQVVVDEDGVGGGVVDLLPGCIGFVANSSPLNKENFANLKAQCAFKLADMVNGNTIYENAEPKVQEMLTEQLEQLKKVSDDPEVKKNIVSKDEIKANIKYSPDDLDTYIMRAIFEVRKVATGPQKLTMHR